MAGLPFRGLLIAGEVLEVAVRDKAAEGPFESRAQVVTILKAVHFSLRRVQQLNKKRVLCAPDNGLQLDVPLTEDVPGDGLPFVRDGFETGINLLAAFLHCGGCLGCLFSFGNLDLGKFSPASA
jgi:predicted metal-binding protein